MWTWIIVALLLAVFVRVAGATPVRPRRSGRHRVHCHFWSFDPNVRAPFVVTLGPFFVSRVQQGDAVFDCDSPTRCGEVLAISADGDVVVRWASGEVATEDAASLKRIKHPTWHNKAVERGAGSANRKRPQ